MAVSEKDMLISVVVVVVEVLFVRCPTSSECNTSWDEPCRQAVAKGGTRHIPECISRLSLRGAARDMSEGEPVKDQFQGSHPSKPLSWHGFR